VLSVKAASWETGCGRLSDGRTLIVAVDRAVWEVGKRHLVVAIAGQAASRSRVEIPFTAQESKEIAQATSDAEGWSVEIRPASLGKGNHARIGVFVHHGEDYFVGDPPSPEW
jgi:hypothetical protein